MNVNNEVGEGQQGLKKLPEGAPALDAPVAIRPKRRLAVVGGGLQLVFILAAAVYMGFYFDGSEFKARLALFAAAHVILFLFCVLVRRFWLALATSIACGITLVIDGVFIWYFWQTPDAEADLWKISLWLVLKLLPVLCLVFLFFWLRSLEKLKRRNQVDRAQVG